MPLSPQNTRNFHRHLYAGQLETVTLIKREDDQRMGTTRKYKLYGCRWSRIQKTGEPIEGDMSSNLARLLHVPRTELDRHSIAVSHLAAADRFVDKQGRYWQPESTTMLTFKLWENHVCLECLRTDPPK